MDSVDLKLYGLALRGQLPAGLGSIILFGGQSFPLGTPIVTADDFPMLGVTTAPVGVTTTDQNPAQE